MRILSTGYHPSVAETDPLTWLRRIDFYTGILEALAHRHEVHSIEHITAAGERTAGGVHYHFRPLSRLAARLPVAEHRFVRRLHPGLVLVNGFNSPSAIMHLRRQLGTRAKILLWHRADKPGSGIRGLLQRYADRCIDGYLFTSPGNAAPWLRSGIIRHEQKVHSLLQSSSRFVPEDRSAARARLGLSEDPQFLWVARLDRNKDPLTVLEAFAHLLTTRPRAQLQLIFQGGELEAAVRAYTAAHPLLRQAVFFRGAVDHPKLADWFNAADYFVCASHYEGSGIALCEALSCGCVPVYSTIPSFVQLAGGFGFSFSAGNPRELAAALRAAVSTDAAPLRQRIRRHFEDHFSFEAIARSLESLVAS